MDIYREPRSAKELKKELDYREREFRSTYETQEDLDSAECWRAQKEIKRLKRELLEAEMREVTKI
jgi:hypothetical protein